MAKNRITTEGTFDRTPRVICNQNFPDVSRCTTQVDVASSTTLTDVTGMTTDTQSIVPGTYLVRIVLNGTSTANGGFKIALKQTTQSSTTMLGAVDLEVSAFTASAVATSRFTSTTDAASIYAVTAVANIKFVIEGIITVVAPGSLKLQVAQNASSVDTTSVYTGSFMTFTQIAA